MRDGTRLLLPQTTISHYASIILGEARNLFHRRKVSYLVLAFTLTAGAVYVASTAYPMVTDKGTPSSSTAGTSYSAQNGTNQGGGYMSRGTYQSSSNQSAISGDASNSTTMQSTVTVNGQNIDVPENGSIHTTVPGNSGQTSVDITHQSSAGGSSSSLNVHVESQSSSGEGIPSE